MVGLFPGVPFRRLPLRDRPARLGTIVAINHGPVVASPDQGVLQVLDGDGFKRNGGRPLVLEITRRLTSAIRGIGDRRVAAAIFLKDMPPLPPRAGTASMNAKEPIGHEWFQADLQQYPKPW